MSNKIVMFKLKKKKNTRSLKITLASNNKTCYCLETLSITKMFFGRERLMVMTTNHGIHRLQYDVFDYDVTSSTTM